MLEVQTFRKLRQIKCVLVPQIRVGTNERGVISEALKGLSVPGEPAARQLAAFNQVCCTYHRMSDEGWHVFWLDVSIKV